MPNQKRIQTPTCSVAGCQEPVGWEIGAKGSSGRMLCNEHGWEAMQALYRTKAQVGIERVREVAP